VADERDDVNKFYDQVRAICKEGSLRNLVTLVESNPKIAERCLVELKKKAQLPGEKGQAFCMIRDDMQTAIFMASKPNKCDVNYVHKALDLADNETEKGARIFWLNKLSIACPRMGENIRLGRLDDACISCLENLVSSCPRAGEFYMRLGDLYLKQRRCGMAIDAYEKAIGLTGDQDSRKLLEEARECQAKYVKQEPLRTADVTDIVYKERTMAPTRQTVRKAEIGNSLQRQVLFDEWSSYIKEQYYPELKVVGESLREGLKEYVDVRIVIEGHADRRGPAERIMQVSKDRAEAIKEHLVKNYGIDASRLAPQGYGAERPYSPEDNEAGWRLNRRVEFKKLEQ